MRKSSLGEAVTLVGDEEVARRAERLKSGSTMRVIGRISSISLHRRIDDRYILTIYLNESKTLSGGLFPPAATQPDGR
jgi:hypothetical protein